MIIIVIRVICSVYARVTFVIGEYTASFNSISFHDMQIIFLSAKKYQKKNKNWFSCFEKRIHTHIRTHMDSKYIKSALFCVRGN